MVSSEIKKMIESVLLIQRLNHPNLATHIALFYNDEKEDSIEPQDVIVFD